MARVLLIFGSQGALGSGVCKKLFTADYDEVYTFDRKHTDEVLPEHVHEIIVGDLREPEAVRDAFASVPIMKSDEYFLFSTIGGYVGGTGIDETAAEDLARMVSVNFVSNFWILQEFIKLIKQGSGGSICVTAAMTGIEAAAGNAAYGAAKAALIHLMETAALEGKAYAMSANTIAPGIIDTPANAGWVASAGLNRENLINPEEIGEVVDNLFRNYRFISGNTVKLKFRFQNL